MADTRTVPIVAVALLLVCLSPAVFARQLRQTDVSVTAPGTNVQVTAPSGSPAPAPAPSTPSSPAPPPADDSKKNEKPVPCKAKNGTTVYVQAPYTTVDVSAPGPCPEDAVYVPAPEGTPAAEVSVQAPYTTAQTGSDGSTSTTINVPGITSINVGTGRRL